MKPSGSKTSKKKISSKKANSAAKSAKGKSAKQKKAQLKFKKMIAGAKAIKKADPSKKWQTCIKESATKMKSPKE